MLSYVWLCFSLFLQSNNAYKVVVLGDLHGDFDSLINILRKNGVVDSNNNWIFGSNKVVSIGDYIGRGHQDKQILEFIKNMTETANWSAQLGNHEIMQLRNDWRYAVDGGAVRGGTYDMSPANTNQCSDGFQMMTQQVPVIDNIMMIKLQPQ